jgi:hypothetical protein
MDKKTLRNLSLKSINNAIIATQESIVIKSLAINEYEKKETIANIEFAGACEAGKLSEEDVEKAKSIAEERALKGNYTQNAKLMEKYGKHSRILEGALMCTKNKRKEEIELEGFTAQLPYLKDLKIKKILSYVTLNF